MKLLISRANNEEKGKFRIPFHTNTETSFWSLKNGIIKHTAMLEVVK